MWEYWNCLLSIIYHSIFDCTLAILAWPQLLLYPLDHSSSLTNKCFAWNGDCSQFNSMTGTSLQSLHALQPLEVYTPCALQRQVSLIPGVLCMGLPEMLHCLVLSWPCWRTSPRYALWFCVGYVQTESDERNAEKELVNQCKLTTVGASQAEMGHVWPKNASILCQELLQGTTLVLGYLQGHSFSWLVTADCTANTRRTNELESSLVFWAKYKYVWHAAHFHLVNILCFED